MEVIWKDGGARRTLDFFEPALAAKLIFQGHQVNPDKGINEKTKKDHERQIQREYDRLWYQERTRGHSL